MFLSNVILFPIVSYKNEKNLSVTTDFPLGISCSGPMVAFQAKYWFPGT